MAKAQEAVFACQLWECPLMSLGFFPSLPYKERSPAPQKTNLGHIRLVGKPSLSYWSRK